MERHALIPVSPPFDFVLTASFFARFDTETVDRFRDGTYRRALWVNGRALAVRVRPATRHLRLTLAGPRITGGEAAAAGRKAAQQGIARINPLLCDGCNQCPPLCKFKAILEKKD